MFPGAATTPVGKSRQLLAALLVTICNVWPARSSDGNNGLGSHNGQQQHHSAGGTLQVRHQHKIRHHNHHRERRTDNNAAYQFSDPSIRDNGCKDALHNFYACVCTPSRILCENMQFKEPDVFLHITPALYPRLESLTILGNNFVFLPKHMFGEGVVHRHLKFLDLSANYLMSIHPLTFAGTPSLETLNLSFNEIVLRQNITGIFQTLPSLKTLVLRMSFNGPPNRTEQLELLVQALQRANLRSLEALNLEDNQFTYIPSQIGCILPHLRQLNYSSNELHDLGQLNHTCLRHLEELDVKGNRLHTPDGNFTSLIDRLPNTLQVRMSYNKFTCTCHLAPFIRWLKKTNKVSDSDRLRCSEAAPDDYVGNFLYLLPEEKLECSISRASSYQNSGFFSTVVLLLLSMVPFALAF